MSTSLRCTRTARLGVLAAALCGALVASAADTVIDFEDLATGTLVTTQYAGVTFSAPPNSCGGSPLILPVLATPTGGTSSGARALTVQPGCPDFSVDYLRMVFDEAHREVSFTLGNAPGTYAVRTYTTTSGGAPVATQNVVLSGTSYVGVYRLVRISRAAADIRRIEVDEAIDNFEYIDDLTLDCPDSTAPTASFVSPAALSCVCAGVSVQGTAIDDDGAIASWRLERKAPDAAVWTLISIGTTEVNNAEFSQWFPAGSATEGYYILRLTVTNACGLISTAETVVFLDRQFDALSEATVRTPTSGAVVGGNVTVDGTAWDQCSGTLAVEKRAASGGVYQPVTTVAAPWVLYDPLGTWLTRGAAADGNYELRVTGTDACGNTAAVTRAVTVDNTPPVALLTSPPVCAYTDGVVPIVGTALDAHLAQWELHYTHHNSGWLPLVSAVGGVNNGLLFAWDMSELPHCAYTLRLRATDTAIVDNDAAKHNVTEAFVSFNLGALGDMDCNGRTDNFDIDPFVACIVDGDCYCP